MKRVMLLLALAGSAAVLIPVQVSASPDDLAIIAKECPTRLKMTATECACIGKQVADLTDGQQKYVAAIMIKDKTAKKKIAKELPPAELAAIEKLVEKGKGPCKGQ
jgi:acyl-CoA synthetase (AMP-forming)/AMP-acid ligase II